SNIRAWKSIIIIVIVIITNFIIVIVVAIVFIVIIVIIVTIVISVIIVITVIIVIIAIIAVTIVIIATIATIVTIFTIITTAIIVTIVVIVMMSCSFASMTNMSYPVNTLTHTKGCRLPKLKYHSSFNLTLTYSSDADIVKTYGVCLPNRETIKKDPSSLTDYIRTVYGTLADTAPWLSQEKPYVSYNRAAGKSRLVAWMVSRCAAASKRRDYVNLLQRYIPVDIYGKCGNHTCLPSRKCEHLLNTTYKFYLAFENSLCPEYITEKVWLRLKEDVVPIVLGEYDETTLSVISDVLDLDVHRTVPSRGSPSPHRGLTAERPGSMETSHLNFIKRGELTDQDA
ncbi:hypothetical protein LSAT2_031895, partial [Lamellibrachia satsuma]